MDPRDPKVLAGGAAALLAAAAIAIGAAGGGDAPDGTRRADIDSEVIAPGELAASEVMLPRGWRVVDVDYVADGWDTLAIEHEDRKNGTRVVIRARNMGDARRLAAWIEYAPPKASTGE